MASNAAPGAAESVMWTQDLLEVNKTLHCCFQMSWYKTQLQRQFEYLMTFPRKPSHTFHPAKSNPGQSCLHTGERSALTTIPSVTQSHCDLQNQVFSQGFEYFSQTPPVLPVLSSSLAYFGVLHMLHSDRLAQFTLPHLQRQEQQIREKKWFSSYQKA